MTTGERIKLARKEAGLTQKELGKRLGITYQTVAQWENDLRNPKYDTLKRIADALNIHIFDLIGIGEELDSYDVQFSVEPIDDKPIPEELFRLLNSGARAIYDSFSEEEKDTFFSESGLLSFLNTSPKNGLGKSVSKEKIKKIPSLSDEAIKLAEDYDRLDHWGKKQVRSVVNIEIDRIGNKQNDEET